MQVVNIMDRIENALEQRKIAKSIVKAAKKYPKQRYVLAIIDDQANTTTGLSEGIQAGLALTAIMALIRVVAEATDKTTQDVLNDLRMCDAQAMALRERMADAMSAPAEERKELLKEIEEEIGKGGLNSLLSQETDVIKTTEESI